MKIPAMIIDFEATDVSKEAEATQLGYRNVAFKNGELIPETVYDSFGEVSTPGYTINCKPDRTISYGAMAVSHITPEDIAGTPSHRDIVPEFLPKGEAYIIAHNADYDIQVAANAGVDVSRYKAICTQALARRLLPDLDSHSLGALTYAIYPDRAREYCRNAHHAGWDVTFTRWLLGHLCELGDITSMEQLYLASEQARIPLAFTFGKHKGKDIKDIAVTDRGYLQWMVKNHENPYMVTACLNALTLNTNINV